MNNNETLPVTPQPKIDTSEVRKASFWVSQICVIVATILGVYLAATQGLKQAIIFDDIRSEKNNAYLRMSLRAEMAGNIEVVNDYIAKVRKDGSLVSRSRALPLQTFIWDSMKFSPTTLETPSEFLMANVDFLRVITYLHGELGSSGISTNSGLKRMEEAVKKLEETVLPKIDANVEEIRTGLKKRNIRL